MSKEFHDYPLDEIVAAVTKKRLENPRAKFYQKFTCAGCGQRLTMPDANQFHEKGTCDQCSVITDIRVRGCNYLVVLSLGA
jgi:hypothetical protein